jgi:hypothetical protein
MQIDRTAHHRITLTQAKAEFKVWLKRNPGASRHRIMKNSRLCNRLRADAPDWFEVHLPPRRRSGNFRDWEETDQQLSAIIVQRAAEGRLQVPPIRVSKRYLLSEPCWRSRARSFREKLPQSCALLDEFAESYEVFYERALRWAAVDMLDRGVPLSKTGILRLTKLSPKAGPFAEAIIRAVTAPV